MAEIKKYTAQIGLQPAPEPNVRVSNVLGEAVEGLGRSISNAAALFQEKKKQKDNFADEAQHRRLQLRLGKGLADLANGPDMPEDGTGFHDMYLSNVYEPEVAAFMAGLSSDEARERYSVLLGVDGPSREEWSIKAAETEHKQTNAWSLGVLAEEQELLANAVDADPAGYAKLLQQGYDSIDKAPMLTTAQRAAERKKWERMAQFAHANKTIKTFPELLVKELSTDFSKLSPTTQFAVLSDAIKFQETGGRRDADSLVSEKGAAGLMQVTPIAARDIYKELGDKNFNPGWSDEDVRRYLLSSRAVNIMYGEAYLNKMIRLYAKTGGLPAVLIAYNGGPSRANAWIKANGDDSVIPEESKNYYHSIMERLRVGGATTGGARGGAPAVDIGRVQIEFRTPKDAELVDKGLQDRVKASFAALGMDSVKVNSGHRTFEENKNAGGAGMSQHMSKEHGREVGAAMDINVHGWPFDKRVALINALSANGIGGIGVGDNIIHADLGPRRVWGYKTSAGGGEVPPWAKAATDAHKANKAVVPSVAGGDAAAVDPAAGSIYASMSYADRQTLISQAELAIEQRSNEEKITARLAIEDAITNAPVAMYSTGRYDGDLPDMEAFMRAYGMDEGIKRFEAFNQSMEVSKTAFSFRGASAEEIKTIVDAAKPTSSGDNAAAEAERYKTLVTAADAVMTARKADPAGYVTELYPNIAAAFSEAEIGDPESFRRAFALSIAAQEKLGIAAVQPLTADVATALATRFNDPEAPETERFDDVVSMVLLSPDKAHRQAVFEQLVKAGLPDHTEGAFEAYARGDRAAGRRLLRAAVVDPASVYGKSVESPATIDEHIKTTLMASGKLMDVYHGLSVGEDVIGPEIGGVDNYVRAERDRKLLVSAANFRMHQGASLKDAVAAAAKDLYGDVKVVKGDSRVNLHSVEAADADEDALIDGLARVLPDVREAYSRQAAVVAPGAGPKGVFEGVIEEGNIDLAQRPVVRNKDGSISTVRSVSANIDGVEVLIPTISPDGKVLTDEEALKLYHTTGQHLGKFDTAESATAYAKALHAAQEDYYLRRDAGHIGTIDAAFKLRIDMALEEGYFRNYDDGYVFIDPMDGAALTDQKGEIIVFKPKPAPAEDTGAFERRYEWLDPPMPPRR